MVFIETPIFTADVRLLLSDDEYGALQEHLVTSPDAGDVISGAGGAQDSLGRDGEGQTWRCRHGDVPDGDATKITSIKDPG